MQKIPMLYSTALLESKNKQYCKKESTGDFTGLLWSNGFSWKRTIQTMIKLLPEDFLCIRVCLCELCNLCNSSCRRRQILQNLSYRHCGSPVWGMRYEEVFSKSSPSSHPLSYLSNSGHVFLHLNA